MVKLEARIPVRGGPASPMKTQTTALDNSSVDATTPGHILHAFLAACWRSNVVEAAHQLSDQFTFTDHALGLEFKDKERLTEFLAKTREFFPDTQRTDNTIVSSEDCVISEWTLTATLSEPLLGGLMRKMPIRARHFCHADPERKDHPVVRLLRPTDFPALWPGPLVHRVD
jgi:SnoaL-like domain